MNRKLLIPLMILAFVAPISYVLAIQAFALGSKRFTIRDESGKVIGNGRILLRKWAQDDQGYESYYSVSVPTGSSLQADCFDGAKRKCIVKVSESHWYIELSPNPYITHNTLWIGGENEHSLELRYEFHREDPPLGYVQF